MGRSVDLRLVFGVKIDEPADHPWYNEEDEGDFDHTDWWRTVKGFAPKFYPYDDDGELLAGATDTDVNAYFNELRLWEAANPLPFDIEYNGSYEAELFVCAPVTKTYDEAIELDTISKVASSIDPTLERKFRAFLDEYYRDASAPRWMLIPFYG